jgi:hypothetical protein
MMADDSVLLQRFVANRDEEAFAELVRRYLNLVYFAALLSTGGSPTAPMSPWVSVSQTM